MKQLFSLVFVVCSLFVGSVFAQGATADDVYDFSSTPAATAQDTTAEVTETNTVAIAEERSAKNSLETDAQALIRDKLIEKYQVKLDGIMDRLGVQLSKLPAEQQREALTGLQARIGEKKDLILGLKTVDTIKRETIVTLLDHIYYRIEGLLQQSAQNNATATTQV